MGTAKEERLVVDSWMVGPSHVDQDGDSVITDTSAGDEIARNALMPSDHRDAESTNNNNIDVRVNNNNNNNIHVDERAAPMASTSKASASGAPSPSGPVCAYGNRLAYTYFKQPAPPQDRLNELQDDIYFFTIDDQLLYLSFFQDSGPLNAACLYRFCLHLHALLEDESLKKRKIFLYSSDEPDKKANAALLVALYAMIVMRWPPADVLHPIACLELQPFRDAGYARADYHLSVQSVIYGIHRAINSHLLDLATFDLAAYETYEKVENGDWNWITPGFLAFASPVEQGYPKSVATGTGGAPRSLSRSFRNVLEEFEKANVKVVIRLNKKLYDPAHFKERGIEHVEMYFDDGTNPTQDMVREFIDLSDKVISNGGVVAVHCKAGLGRTGTLIGAYLIYKHGFTASEAIGFMRLMRPGSCVGPQQHFLYENQMTWVRWSAVDEYKKSIGAGSASRPITPAANAEASTSSAKAAAAVTPTRSQQVRHAAADPLTPEQPTVPRTPSRSAVPGQPRKTPGKSKHAVATPEQANDSTVVAPASPTGDMEVDEIDKLGNEEQDELMLVKDDHKSAPSNAPMTSTPGSPRKMSTRPTRIAARARPAPVDPSSGSGVASQEVRRSRSVKDLGSVSPSTSSTSAPAMPASVSEPRYSLRKSNSGGVNAAATVQQPQQPLQPAPSLSSTRASTSANANQTLTSPSKLPVVRKRGKRSHTIVAPTASTSVPADLSSIASGSGDPVLPAEASILKHHEPVLDPMDDVSSTTTTTSTAHARSQAAAAAAANGAQHKPNTAGAGARSNAAQALAKKVGLRGVRKRRSSVGCDEGA